MAYASFEQLKVWKRSCRLAVDVSKLLRDCKEYGIKDQMSRSAVSIASNIAEGAERGSKAEFIRFLSIAKGSAVELRTQVYIVAKLGSILPEDKIAEIVSKLKEISNMLQGLIKSQQHKRTFFLSLTLKF